MLFSAYLFDGDWTHSRRYLVPVLSFMLGIFVAECIHRHFKHMERVYWRQLILLAEIVLLFLVGFLPQGGQHGCQRARFVRLRHAGADLPQGARPRLCEHDVHRQYAQRHGGAVRLLFPRFLAPTDNRSWANNRFLYTNVLRSFRCFCNLLLVLSIPVTLPHA